ncbi:MAG: S49 family peptidase, partial [Firmicutes bacterium]|nr:S49 family peptidase [Bacillota bacterium]
ASGGYYVACAADKIIANRNCITGSIGVKIGTFFDLTKLMETYGIDAYDLASGDHKNMGSYFEAMSDEEKAIYQSIVDEMYGRFVDVVADSRNMSEEDVRKLADGRIYTAAQTMDLGLIDEIAGYEQAIVIMSEDCGQDLEFIDVLPDTDYSWFDIIRLLGSSNSKNPLGALGFGGSNANASDAEDSAVKFFYLSDRITPSFL